MFKKTALTIFFALALFFLAIPNSVFAQEVFRVRFSPTILELNLNPGDTYQDFIKFENLSSDKMSFYPLVQDFVPEGEIGGKRFLTADEIAPSFSLVKWVHVANEKITLQKGEKAAIPFTIIVPKDAEPGGHYGAVLMSSVPAADLEKTPGGAEVVIASRVGPIILIRISGEITESARIAEFTSGKNFYEYPSVNFVARVENIGNVHLKPFGQITIKDIFGKVKENLPVNEKLSNVLPQSIRKFEVGWEKKGFTLGKYTATLAFTYGESNQKTIVDILSFWIVPWKVLIVGALGLVIVILGFALGLKKYNAFIVQKYTNGQDTDEQHA